MKDECLHPTCIVAETARWHDELVKQRHIIEKRLVRYPKGKLHIVNSGGRVQYYLRMNPGDKSGEYVSKDNEKLLHTYAQKKYDERLFGMLTKEIEEIEKIMKRLKRSGEVFSESVKNVFAQYPMEVHSLINPVDMTDDEFVARWNSEEYIRKTVDESVPMYETIAGDKVRSKSELNIANLLYKYGVPYKYEYPFELKSGRTVYPDFTVLNVRKRKVIYWEHRGMMDDREYSRNAVYRNKELMKAGLILGDNFVISEETSMLPLGTDEIELIIRSYLL